MLNNYTIAKDDFKITGSENAVKVDEYLTERKHGTF